MRKLLQINITANWGSHGKIAEGIGMAAIKQGWQSFIAYGRWANPSASNLFHIGSRWDEMHHAISSRLFDNHGLMSKKATAELIQYAERIKPDIVHLHNIHGYYLNYPLLFQYLAQNNIPVVWTLHDCWTFTGHCAHYEYCGCEQWKTHCLKCPQKHAYPKSWLTDRSYRNFEQKKETFLSLKHLTLVPVSQWLQRQLQQSFFKHTPTHLIYNGIDTDVFSKQTKVNWIKKKYAIPEHCAIVLGIASNWYRKGLPDFLQLASLLPPSIRIVLVGLSKSEQQLAAQAGIIAINRTDNIQELCALYSAANVYFNPTWEDTFPTTNLEAMACGTPVVTYKTGGSTEAITLETGAIIEKGDLQTAAIEIGRLCQQPTSTFEDVCRQHIVRYFNKEERFLEYLNLYAQYL
ncbi:MAG: glycosyltransferase [Hoylesella shahii]|uniref:glycosyltransferase n=1 Tax=Hoylesella shahii TaxID=228603 RepID=UPI003FA0202C